MRKRRKQTLRIPAIELPRVIWFDEKLAVTLAEALASGRLEEIWNKLADASEDVWYQILRARYADSDPQRGVIYMGIGFFTYGQLLEMMTNRDSRAGRMFFESARQALLYVLGMILAPATPMDH